MTAGPSPDETREEQVAKIRAAAVTLAQQATSVGPDGAEKNARAAKFLAQAAATLEFTPS